MRIAIQGAPGSFHHIAAQHWYGDEHTYINADSFAAVFNALAAHKADVAVVAVENSLYGSITEVYDLLLRHNYLIVGEVTEHIHQNLIGTTGTKLSAITRVYSHPVALAQCAAFLDTELPDAEIIEHHDTAAAVEYVKQSKDDRAAAIASSFAAEMHDMTILRPSIQDERGNFTRFLIIEPNAKPPADTDKASLVLTTSHTPGALYKALGVFAEHESNLTKLESRPIRGEVWQYQFYVDVNISQDKLEQAIETLNSQGCSVRNLGSYKAATTTYDD